MTATSSHSTSTWRKWLGVTARFPWIWLLPAAYLFVMLLLPTVALLLKASTEGPARFWSIATSPIALDAYRVTFVTALITAFINGVFGLLIAWVLVRYEFPFKKIIDAAVDLPFALPTSVAGLTLATVYSENGWIGSLVAPFSL